LYADTSIAIANTQHCINTLQCSIWSYSL